LRASRPYRNEVPQHPRSDPPSSPAGCRPHVLSHQYRCGCGKFGTTRPRTVKSHVDVLAWLGVLVLALDHLRRGESACFAIVH